MPKVNLFGDTGESWNDSISASECVNMIPSISKTKNTLVFDKLPGTSSFYETATAADLIQSVYAIPSTTSDSVNFAGRVYFIHRNGGTITLKNIEGDGTVNSVGTVTPSLNAQWAHDKSETGGKILIISSNASNYSEVTLNSDPSLDSVSNKTFSYGNINHVTYFDGYFFVGVVISGNRRRVHATDFGTATFSALSYGDITTKPDALLRIYGKNHELWKFCEHHIEVWYNAGNSGYPLLRNNSIDINIGLAAEYSLVDMDGTFIFLGGTKNGNLGIYKTKGYALEDITPNLMRYDMDHKVNFRAGLDVLGARGRKIILGNFELYVINFNDSVLGTWIFNLKSGLWFKEKSDGVEYSKYLNSSYSFQWLGEDYGYLNLIVEYQTDFDEENRIDYYDITKNVEVEDATDPYKDFVMKSNFIQGEDNNQVIHERLQIKFNPINTTLTLKVEFSDDEESTWDVVGTFDISDTVEGLIDLYGLGASRKRIYRITSVMAAAFSDQLTLTDAWLSLKQLNS